VTAVANPCKKWLPNKDQFFGIVFFSSTATASGPENPSSISSSSPYASSR